MVNVTPSPDAPHSVPALLRRNAAQFGSSPAYREKEFGIWQSWTWAETADEIEALALADEAVVKALAGGQPKKLIVVPGRIVNVVV